MCGRFSLTKEELEIEKRFNAKFYSNDLVRRYNVAPSQLALVMTNEQPAELRLFRWGLIPSWAKDPSIGNKMINARAETIFEKPAFRNLVRKRRCLVISDGFYEWMPLHGKRKQPYRIGLMKNELFAFAGLWDQWTDNTTGEIIPTFTIITTRANDLVAPVHDRMPAILSPESESKWLRPVLNDSEIMQLLQPLEPALMHMYPVSDKVNSPKNDTPDIIDETLPL
jgi:putative SOS response-associated peptidase YedK